MFNPKDDIRNLYESLIPKIVLRIIQHLENNLVSKIPKMLVDTKY